MEINVGRWAQWVVQIFYRRVERVFHWAELAGVVAAGCGDDGADRQAADAGHGFRWARDQGTAGQHAGCGQ